MNQHTLDGECWNPPLEVAYPHLLVVKLRIELDIDGELTAPPRIIDTPMPAGVDAATWSLAQTRAQEAIEKCAPFDFLPPDRHEEWREMVVTFDPAMAAPSGADAP